MAEALRAKDAKAAGECFCEEALRAKHAKGAKTRGRARRQGRRRQASRIKKKRHRIIFRGAAQRASDSSRALGARHAGVGFCAEALGAKDARAARECFCEEALRAKDAKGAKAREGAGAAAAAAGV